MTQLIILFVFTVGVSFVCSVLEAVLLSISHSHVVTLEKEGRKSGKLLAELKNSVGRPLAAILTLNTLAHTAGATGVGAQAVQVLQQIEGLKDSYIGQHIVFITSAVLTIAILVLSEIIPKTVGTVYCKVLSVPSAYTIKGIIFLTYPLVIIFERLTNCIQGDDEPVKVSREEMMAVARIGASEGTIGAREARIIENIIKLVDIRVEDVMTPRAVVAAFQRDLTVKGMIEGPQMVRFSRIPVFTNDMDDIDGIVLRYDILKSHADQREEVTLGILSNPVHVVPESMSVGAVMDEFIKRNEQMFIVVDEYGGTAGLITLEDAIETLLGVEIVDELDTVADMRKHARELFARKKRSAFLVSPDKSNRKS